MNLHDAIYVTSDDRVIDVWAVDARGSSILIRIYQIANPGAWAGERKTLLNEGGTSATMSSRRATTPSR